MTFTPVPESGTDCGLPAALFVTEIFAVSAPIKPGVNVTMIVQAVEVASVEAQLLVWLKSAEFVPAIEMAMPVIKADPVLVRVTGIAVLGVEIT